MDSKEFYNYIMENFSLDGTSARLVDNIIGYVNDQGFTDAEDAQRQLHSLLYGAFGIEESEIKLYRAPMCEVCGEYVPEWSYDDGDVPVCLACSSDDEAGGGDDGSC